MTLCFYHNDADGRSSAAIVRRALGKKVLLHEINYGDPIDWDLIAPVDHVIMVDFSLAAPEMERLSRGRRFTWIDHHISAINTLQDISTAWEGSCSPSQAACVLTWRYFFPDQPIPRSVLLIDDRDTWTNALPDSPLFGEGLNQQNANPENDRLWKPLLDDDPKAVQDLISLGSVLHEARLKDIRRSVTRFGQQVIFEGYKTLVINRRGDGDIGEYICRLGYDLAYCYIEGPQNGKVMTFVTLISKTVDVSVIAQKFAGGGHRGAAGFSFERTCSPFPEQADWRLE